MNVSTWVGRHSEEGQSGAFELGDVTSVTEATCWDQLKVHLNVFLSGLWLLLVLSALGSPFDTLSEC